MGTVIVHLPASSSLISSLVGPLSMSPGIAAPLTASTSKDWWVAIEHGEPVGVVAADYGRKVVLLHAFVAEAHRGRGIYSALFIARQTHVETLGLPMRSVIVPASIGLFIRAGFRHVRNRGRFAVMEKP